MPATLLLHAGHAVNLGAWDFHPSVVGGALAVAGVYLYAALKQPRFDWLRAGSFYFGATLIFLVLVSPLDAAADRLLSMHMLQHVVLTTIGPPLVVLGLPAAALSGVARAPGVGRALRVATSPAVAGTLFVANMWLWHVPPVYGAALDQLPVHIAMHIAFMATGLLFWWPVIQPVAAWPRASELVLIVYLIATGFPMGLISLLFFASGSPVYDYYVQGAQLWGVSPLIDQQIAGIVMGALGEAASFVAITFLFFRFLDREEARASSGSLDAA